MATIYINTDLLRQLSQLFVQLNDQIQNNIGPQIQSVTSQLENDWQGQSRVSFDQMYQDWYSSTAQVTQIGDDLGRHLQYTADQFEQADQPL